MADITSTSSLLPGQGDALVIIDLQRDFLLGGALAVPCGDQVIPVLNRYLNLFAARALPVFATRDWHPPNHCSFIEQGGPWPVHCVMDSVGAEFAAELQLPPDTQVISKATQADREAYSDFTDAGFHAKLQEQGIKRLFVGGLATEYCVLATVRKAIALGYDVILLIDAIRSIDVVPGDGRRAEEEMIRLGAVPMRWENLAMSELAT